jgi:transcriptional regulator with XRE-family HTH domain
MLLKSSHDFQMQLSFGEWFLLRRRSKQLSQGDIAKALQVTSQTVSNWENGKSVPSLDPDQFFKLCKLLDISMEDLAAAFRGEIDTSG